MCVCGEPQAAGVVHRDDGPCYHEECTCEVHESNPFFMEHEIRCPLFEPPLTQAEIRQVRSLLAAGKPLYPLGRPVDHFVDDFERSTPGAAWQLPDFEFRRERLAEWVDTGPATFAVETTPNVADQGEVSEKSGGSPNEES